MIRFITASVLFLTLFQTLRAQPYTLSMRKYRNDYISNFWKPLANLRWRHCRGKMKKTFLCIATVLIPALIYAQAPETLWTKTFTFGGLNDIPVSIILDSNNNIYVNGHKSTGDPATVQSSLPKFNSNGDILWIVHDSADVWTGSGYGGTAIISDSNIVWYSVDWFSLGGWLTAYNINSTQLWRQEINDLLYITSYEDTILAVTVSNGGTDTSQALFLDSDGALQRSFPITDVAIGIITPHVQENNLWISALYFHGGVVNVNGFVAKYDIVTGELFWRWEFEDAVRSFCTIDTAGNIYFTASQATNDTSGFLQYILVKLDPDGNVLWYNKWFAHSNFEANYENWVNGVAVSDLHNQVVVYGSTQKGMTHTANKSNYIAGFNTQTGDSLWTMQWEYDEDAIINAIRGGVFDSNDDLILLGNTFTGGTIPNQGYLQKYRLLTIGVDEEVVGLPVEYVLSQAYPNPFNPTTTIEYSLSKSGHVSLIIYNLLGQEVTRLINGIQNAGYHKVTWDASNMASGVYLYRLEVKGRRSASPTFVQTRKMVLLK